MTVENPYFTAQILWQHMREDSRVPLQGMVDHVVRAYFSHPSLQGHYAFVQDRREVIPNIGWQPYIVGYFQEMERRAQIIVGSAQFIRLVQPQIVDPERADLGVTQSWQGFELRSDGYGSGILAQLTQCDYVDTNLGPYRIRTTQEVIPPMDVLNVAMEKFDQVRIWHN